MNRVVVIAMATLGIAAGLTVAADAQGPRRDGRWEVMVEMTMPGMPGSMPPSKSEYCLTPEEAENPQSLLPQQARGEAARKATAS